MFKLGPFGFYPRVSGTVYYDDNINSTAANRLKDIAWTVAPGFAATARNSHLDREKLFTLEYTPVLRFYVDHDEFNSIDHGARIAGSWSGSRLTLGFNQGFLVASQPIPDVGGRADAFNSASSLSSEWRLGYKTSLEVDAALAVADYSQLTSSRDWSNSDWLNYRLSSRLGLGVGFVAGYLDVENELNQPPSPSADQTYEQLRARAVYTITEKVRLSASGGAELRQYRGGVADTLAPVWDIAGTFRPWRDTTLTLAIFQRYSNSARSADQNYLNTGVGASVAQRLWDRFFLTLDGNYNRADYRATVANVVTGRLDDIFHARVGLSVYLARRWSAGIYYSHDRDRSSDSTFSYSRNQFGLESSWSF